MAKAKQATKGRSKSNGTSSDALITPAATPAPLSQPSELSDTDRTKVKNWLDKHDKPFAIHLQPLATASKKRKRGSVSRAALQTQSDLYEERLSVQYEVRPRDKWECLRRYKKFTVGSESIAIGQCVLIKHEEGEDAKLDVSAQWKAKVLEVRALDPEHVYIRVAWLNRPEDLADGRKSYHGKNELIPTNEIDVIDAMAVNGSFEIIHWDEKDDESTLAAEDQYFWRQTYDFASTKTFSELRSICVDNAPQNPDEMILQCGNPDCRKWQHVKCIAETAVQKAAHDTDEHKLMTKKARPKHVKIESNSRAQAKAQTDTLAAEVFIKGLPDGDGASPAGKSEIVVADANGERSRQTVSCLFCEKSIE